MFFLLLILGIFVLDNLIKRKIEKARNGTLPREAGGGFIIITRSHNYSMMMNSPDQKPGLAKLLSSASSLACLICYLRELRITSDKGLLLGDALFLVGAASNIFDHLFRGNVVDYFKLCIRPIQRIIFNISDFCQLRNHYFFVPFSKSTKH